MNKFGTLAGLALLVAGLSVAYYFAIFLPKTQAQDDLAKNQSSCLEAEQNLLKELAAQEQQAVHIYGINVPSAYTPVKAHYNTVLKECFVEVDNYYESNDTSTSASNFLGNDYAIYDASEDSEIAHCSMDTNYSTYSGSSNTTQCETLKNSPLATSTSSTITPVQFQALETQYLTP